MSADPRPIARPHFASLAAVLVAGLIIIVAPSASAHAQAALPVVEGSPGFDPSQYTQGGDAFNCANFRSQAEAQAVLRANPADPNRLDTDRPFPDGIACEHNPAPFDTIAVPR